MAQTPQRRGIPYLLFVIMVHSKGKERKGKGRKAQYHVSSLLSNRK